ncbi:SEC-C metal-binding domain-containing protein [Halomonas llamarensis]|uniref:SEC-C metal-binding domain-containing protein n=1 Tax=Halomonas llamarensis TaxID=2945104 RepID=A0ABT0SVB9_9GAMM|nr:SEC-C metal-binding domain-containing protein [Halomonas llamarensis]MCL7931672.1 SEC-C metal-binding domain-containing protein [Halomonas llamarensis]
MIGVESPEIPEDISDLEKLLNPEALQLKSTKVPRNSPCPCGSGKKYKKCCENIKLTP